MWDSCNVKNGMQLELFVAELLEPIELDEKTSINHFI